MSNIIPFESSTLPAYLKAANVQDVNSDLTSHAGTGFPVISIKGKVFAVVRDGERTVLPNPKDPDSPATSIEVVILKSNKQTSKVFYLKGYTDGAENQKPDCFSNDGTKPDAGSESPQSTSCATCKHNQWGSKISDNGSKGKACSDSVRLAIAQPDLLNDPYLLRVPPATIKALGEYGKALAKRGVPYNAVVTKIGFDMEAPTPKLTFKATAYLSNEGYMEAQEVIAGDVVASILGTEVAAAPARSEDDPMDGIKGTPPAAAKAAAPKPAAAAPKPAPSKSKTVTDEEVAAAVAAPAEVEVDVGGLNLDDLNFDD